MDSARSEKASEFFSRCQEDDGYFSLDKNILPKLSSMDLVKIGGETGSGKTELLYHFVTMCIMPNSPIENIDIVGLEKKVYFIDNRLDFSIIRLIQVLEKRLMPAFPDEQKRTAFIEDRLKYLEIITCKDFEEYITTLSSVPLLECKNLILMIDEVAPYDFLPNWKMLPRVNLNCWDTKISTILKDVSNKCNIPIIATKRTLLHSSVNFGRAQYSNPWHKLFKWQIELKFESSIENSTNIYLQNLTTGQTILCGISSAGFKSSPYF